MDANNNNNHPEGSQSYNPAVNSSGYQAAWNPYMYGFQAPLAAWFPQGFQHPPPTAPMMQPSSNDPMMHATTNGPGFPPPPYVGSSPQPERSVQHELPQDADVEEVPNPPGQSPPSIERRKRLSSRTKLGNFNPNEDVYLVKAWLEISCDPIISTGQRKDRMWDRIMERYNFRRGGYPARSLRSLQSRWANIKEAVGKFAGFYADTIRENPSGMSDADKATHAAATYADVLKHNFPYMHCWELMKDEPTWREPSQRGGGTVHEGDGFDDNIGQDSNTIDLGGNTAGTISSVGKRLMGRDSAKAAKKKSNTSSGSTSSSEYASRMQDLSLQKITFLQEETVHKGERFQQLASIDEKRYEEMHSHNQSVLDLEQEKVRIMHEKHDLTKEKEEKKEDERILMIDLNSCTPPLRMYYQALQEEILEKVATRGQRRQGP